MNACHPRVKKRANTKLLNHNPILTGIMEEFLVDSRPNVIKFRIDIKQLELGCCQPLEQ
jgi:hypothetical protein